MWRGIKRMDTRVVLSPHPIQLSVFSCLHWMTTSVQQGNATASATCYVRYCRSFFLFDAFRDALECALLLLLLFVCLFSFLPDAFRDALECTLLLLFCFCFMGGGGVVSWGGGGGVVSWEGGGCFMGGGGLFHGGGGGCFLPDAFRALKAHSQPDRPLGTVHAEMKGCLCWGSGAISVSLFYFSNVKI